MATIKWVLFAFSLAILTSLYVQPGSAQQATATAQEHAVRANESLKSGHPEKAIPEFQALIALGGTEVGAGTLTDALWPDFNGVKLLEAIAEFQKRERRFGGIHAIHPPSVQPA